MGLVELVGKIGSLILVTSHFGYPLYIQEEMLSRKVDVLV